MLVLGLICFTLMGISEAVMDTLQFHFYKSKFSKFKKQLFWDPTISWKNKYKNGDPKKHVPPFYNVTSWFNRWLIFQIIKEFISFCWYIIIGIIVKWFWVSCYGLV